MADYYSEKDKVIKLAEADTKFKEELKKDPKAAIEKHFPLPDGKKIPDKINVVVVEDSADTVYINISSTDAVKSSY
ncbi:NHLP leader peptide family natural product precursor [bacterium]|nr:NHLP leader peptide family natural product precursor [bacterium]